MLGIDFLYYWWHRASHEINFFWAGHVVHHQSEDYNLAVALRQSVTTAWTSLPFYLPLALLGVSTRTFLVFHGLSLLYQFWIHTRLIPKVGGPLDWVLNLPHHHRVHHAINPQYLDKNYAATLIVWDRLFGTYEEEREECVYGITSPIRSFNPLWAEVQGYVDLLQKGSRLGGLSALKLWLVSPAHALSRPKEPAPPLRREKFDVEVAPRTRAYVLAQYVALLLITSVLLLFDKSVSQRVSLMGCASLACGLASLGGLLEKKPWAWPLEIARLGGLATTGALLVL